MDVFEYDAIALGITAAVMVVFVLIVFLDDQPYR